MNPTVSLVLTINNRSPEVSKAVADSFRLPGNEVDEIVVVMDRPTPDARQGAFDAWMPFAVALPSGAQATEQTLKFPEVHGDQGWKGPARAWNAGFRQATGDLLYCISSEVVQEPANVAKARELARDLDTAVFGACHNSTPVQLVNGAEPGLLVSSKMPRPLGFIVCMPRKAVQAIGGFDEKFMDGFWFDDDDFFLRLWRTGIDFHFSDSIHGTHIHHERPDLSQEGIQRNAQYMAAKHGTTMPWQNLLRRVKYGSGFTEWSHP